MPYRLDIPGQVSEFQLRAIEAVASLVPPNGCVVEVGSLFGLSSWAWAKSVPKGATVHCIDPWEGNEGARRLEQAYGVKYGIEQFRTYLADCDNVTPIQAYSPEGVSDWKCPVDLYYEDAVHNDPILSRNVAFWTSHLTPNGIVCGDDYRPRFADVRAAAEAQAKRLGRKLWIVDFFWCVLPDPAAVPAAKAVAETLAGLAEEVARARAGTPAKVEIGPLVPLPALLGAPAVRKIRVVNDGATAWPLTPSGELKLRCQLVRPDGSIIAQEDHGLGVAQLAYDSPIDQSVVLPFGNRLPAEAKLRIAIIPPNATAAPVKPFEQAVKIDVPPTPPPYRPGAIALFGQGGDGAQLLGSGWSQPERVHCWSKGIHADIAIDLPPKHANRGWLNLRLRPFVGGACPAQRLTILANEEEIFSGRIGGPASLSVPVPLVGNCLKLLMIHPDACRPVDVLPGSQDSRVLAFALEALALTDQPLTL